MSEVHLYLLRILGQLYLLKILKQLYLLMSLITTPESADASHPLKSF